MKYLMLTTAIITSTFSFTMENIEIRDRNLDTAQKPHITIINKLPKDHPGFSTTRIDISDKIVCSKELYQPDDSTVTIYSNQGIRFSPRYNKLVPKSERLGMNDAGDAARIALYVHGATKYPYAQLTIGYSSFPFGTTLIITAEANGGFSINHDSSSNEQ